MTSPGEHWPRHPPTVRLDDGPPSELSKRENRRMRRAMMRERPLPPRLARAAVQYAPKLQRQAQLGWFRAAARARRAVRTGRWPELTGRD